MQIDDELRQQLQRRCDDSANIYVSIYVSIFVSIFVLTNCFKSKRRKQKMQPPFTSLLVAEQTEIYCIWICRHFVARGEQETEREGQKVGVREGKPTNRSINKTFRAWWANAHKTITPKFSFLSLFLFLVPSLSFCPSLAVAINEMKTNIAAAAHKNFNTQQGKKMKLRN